MDANKWARMAQKPYRYKTPSPRKPRFALNRLKRIETLRDATPLTGYVNGMEATDIEERFARALRALHRDFSFQVSFPTDASSAGREKVVDFLVYGRGGYLAPPTEEDDSPEVPDKVDSHAHFGPRVTKYMSAQDNENRREFMRLLYPVEIYGYIGHETEGERGKDALRQALLNETFKQDGIQPMQVVWYWELDTQEMADRKAKEMFTWQ